MQENVEFCADLCIGGARHLAQVARTRVGAKHEKKAVRRDAQGRRRPGASRFFRRGVDLVLNAARRHDAAARNATNVGRTWQHNRRPAKFRNGNLRCA